MNLTPIQTLRDQIRARRLLNDPLTVAELHNVEQMLDAWLDANKPTADVLPFRRRVVAETEGGAA